MAIQKHFRGQACLYYSISYLKFEQWSIYCLSCASWTPCSWNAIEYMRLRLRLVVQKTFYTPSIVRWHTQIANDGDWWTSTFSSCLSFWYLNLFAAQISWYSLQDSNLPYQYATFCLCYVSFRLPNHDTCEFAIDLVLQVLELVGEGLGMKAKVLDSMVQ